MKPGRLGVGIVGAGRVGPVVGAALAAAGHAIVGVHAIGDDEIERVEAMLPNAPILDVPTLIERSELVVLAVPSDALAGLVEGLASAGLWRPGQLVLHTAAEYGVDVLLPAARSGAIPLALHPAMVFTGTSIDLARLVEAHCAVTAPGPVLPIAQALAVEMGAEPVVIEDGDRAAYAEAIATASHFSDAIVSQAASQLAGIGVERPGRLLEAVVRSSVDVALRRHYGDGAPDIEVPGSIDTP